VAVKMDLEMVKMALLTGYEDFLPLSVIAAEWNLSANMVRKYLARGCFPPDSLLKVGGQWYITRRGAFEAMGPPRKEPRRYPKRRKKRKAAGKAKTTGDKKGKPDGEDRANKKSER